MAHRTLETECPQACSMASLSCRTEPACAAARHSQARAHIERATSHLFASCSKPPAPLRCSTRAGSGSGEQPASQSAPIFAPPALSVPRNEWDPKDNEEGEDWESLTEEEVEDRVDEAASFICVVDDLRPIDARAFNPCYEIWRRVARIPPAARVRLLDELEPGSIRSLWKASMARYVLDDARSLEILGDYSVFLDFPDRPGVVVEYRGKCERYGFGPDAPGSAGPGRRSVRFFADEERPRALGKAPVLRPSTSSFSVPSERFRMQFFVQPGRGELYGRLTLPLWGGVLGLEQWWVPSYFRVVPELVLTPMQADAGADITLVFPADAAEAAAKAQATAAAVTAMQMAAGEGGDKQGLPGAPASAGQALLKQGQAAATSTSPSTRAAGEGAELGRDSADRALGLQDWGQLLPADLPDPSWPPPDPSNMCSPFSLGRRDFMRPVAPGVYVGCGYRAAPGSQGRELREEDFVYFLVVRTSH